MHHRGKNYHTNFDRGNYGDFGWVYFLHWLGIWRIAGLGLCCLMVDDAYRRILGYGECFISIACNQRAMDSLVNMDDHKTYFKKNPTRLKGKAMEQLRRDVFNRAGGRCERCGAWAPWGGDVFTRGHLAHHISRGAGGGDTAENTTWLCPECHLNGDHGLKWSFRHPRNSDKK